MKRTTIKDLAGLLNLSTSTISRALSDHPDISERTKNRVREAASAFNYLKNVHAGTFRSQRSGLIALIIPEINPFHTPNLIKAIDKATESSDYSLIIFISNDSLEREVQLIKKCLNWSVEGVLISLSKETVSLEHLNPLKKFEIQCVLIDKVLENDTFPSVTIDGAKAGYKAATHLIEKGHTNILGIFGNPKFSISKDRMVGFKSAFEKNKLELSPDNIISIDKSSSLDFILPTILSNRKNYTAIFVMSDELLAVTLYHINKLGLKIPEDLSVIAISDGMFPYLSYPNITHVKDSGKKLGKTASKLLFNSMRKQNTDDHVNMTISTKIVKLNSVANLLSLTT